jgi:hypothetical protein
MSGIFFLIRVRLACLFCFAANLLSAKAICRNSQQIVAGLDPGQWQLQWPAAS